MVEEVPAPKHAESEPIDSQQMLEIVLDNIPQAVFWKDREGRYLGGNQALLRVVGLQSREEGIGKTDFDMPWRASAPSIIEIDRWVMEAETPKLNYEELLILADGTTRWMRKNKLPLRNQEGKVVGVVGTAEDITACKQVALDAKLREELLDGYFKSSPLGMFLIDRELRFLRVSDTLAVSNGYAVEELLGKTIGEVLPQFAPVFCPYCERVFATGEAIVNTEITGPACEPGDSASHYVVSLFPVGEEDGHPLAVGGIVKDITRRKREEEKLLLTQFSIDHAIDGALWAKLDGRFFYVNDAACRILGYSHQELESMAIWDVDCDITETGWPRTRGELKDRSPVTFESRVLAKDGRIIPVEIDLNFIHHKGQELIIGFMHDKTERRRVEEDLRLTQFAMDHANDPVFRANSEGRICYVNDAACRTFGYSREEVRTMTVADLNCDVSKAKWPALWARLKERGALTFESRDRTKEGNIIPVEVSLNFLSYAGKEHGFAFVRDMTEHKRAEEDLRNSFDRLRALASRLQSIREEERKEAAREIHDQLGQALTAIKLEVSALRRDWPTEHKPPSPRIESILTLVDEMIGNVRRISTELRPGILDDLGLAAAIEWAAEQFQLRTGIACQVEAPEGVTPAYPQAAIAIFRIFQETLTNVARHSGATRVDIRLAEEDDGLRLEVQDNGRGINSQKVSHDKSLGILGMRERALSVGGEITIRGTPGGGTTVAVWVPDTWRATERVLT